MTPSTTVDSPRVHSGLLPPGRLDLAGHLHRHGPVPWAAHTGPGGRERFIESVAAAGLRGRGGAGFPTARKLRAVLSGRGPVVLANGCEGEPLSGKDHALLSRAPHLVLDGIQLAAHTVGATEAFLCLHQGSSAEGGVRAALAERSGGVPVRITPVPARYVASEESALVNLLNTGVALPTVTPPRPAERGVRGRPTLVDNVDTLAQLAIIARIGAEAYLRTGTTLVTVTGAVRTPGVREIATGGRIGDVLELAGGATGPLGAVLLGGYGGTWLPLPEAARLPLTHEAAVGVGASLGVAAVFAHPAAECGLSRTAEILAYLAGESARQCGPCMFGLPAIAADFAELATGGTGSTEAARRLATRLPVLPGRGACAHPDGAVRLAASALRVFAPDVAAHAAGRGCLAGNGGRA